MVMWMLSKCVHMAGVGFVNRPCAKVSAASRELKSFAEKGKGVGHTRRIARRRRNAEKPTRATASPLRRANLPKMRSILLK